MLINKIEKVCPNCSGKVECREYLHGWYVENCGEPNCSYWSNGFKRNE